MLRILACGALAALLVACGGSGDKTTPTALSSATGPATAPAASPSAAATAAPTSTAVPGAAPIDYTSPANWLCRPGKANTPCTSGLDLTVVGANGSRTVQPFTPATDPPIDCFYIYPTVSTDPGLNSDMIPGDGETRAVANQAARFGSECRVFAPDYRQVTLNALNSGGFFDANANAIAQGDVLNAWNEYLANDNHGRGVVLIGHSQGSMRLKTLISGQIDNNPAERSLIVSAILLGGDVHVPAGKDTGGDFQNIPACRTATQAGCVVAYSSFPSTAPPPANSLFARGDVLCTNPAALGGGPSSLKSIFPTGNTPGITTPFVEYVVFKGECVAENGFSYLKVTAPPGSTFPGPEITAQGPQWGLHVVDSNLTLGDQLTLVASQTAAYVKR